MKSSEKTMKKALIAIMGIVLLIAAAGCAGSQGGVDGADTAIANPIDDGEATSPFAIPDEEIDGEEYVEAGEETDSEGEADTDSEAEADDTASGEIFISGDADIEVELGQAIPEKTYIADYEEGGDHEFDWEIAGAPAWLSTEAYGKRKLIISGTPATAGTFTVTLTAIDSKGAANSATFAITIVVVGPDLPKVSVIDGFEDRCKRDLVISFGEDSDSTEADMGVDIGTTGHTIELVAKRGDLPAKGKVSWTWKSKILDSFYCQNKDDGHDSTGPDFGSIDESLSHPGAINIGRDAYYPPKGRTDCFDRQREEGKWVRNTSWMVPGAERKGTPSGAYVTNNDILELRGDFLFSGEPMPVRKYREDGKDDLSRRPTERLKIRVKDECDDEGTEIDLTFALGYPDDRVADIKVRLEYNRAKTHNKDWNMEECSDPFDKGWCIDFSPSNLGFLFYDEMPEHDSGEECKAVEVDCLADASLGYSVFPMQTLEKNRDSAGDRSYEYEQGVKRIANRATVDSVNNIVLRTAAKGKWNSGSSRRSPKFDKIDIEEIEFETDYWYADYRDEDDTVYLYLVSPTDPWQWQNNKLANYPQTWTLNDYDEMSRGNTDGGVFRRKTWLPK